FDPGSVRFIAHAQIDSQAIGGPPVILDVHPKDTGSLSPLAARDAFVHQIGFTEIEIRSTVATHTDGLSFTIGGAIGCPGCRGRSGRVAGGVQPTKPDFTE